MAFTGSSRSPKSSQSPKFTLMTPKGHLKGAGHHHIVLPCMGPWKPLACSNKGKKTPGSEWTTQKGTHFHLLMENHFNTPYQDIILIYHLLPRNTLLRLLLAHLPFLPCSDLPVAPSGCCASLVPCNRLWIIWRNTLNQRNKSSLSRALQLHLCQLRSLQNAMFPPRDQLLLFFCLGKQHPLTLLPRVC